MVGARTDTMGMGFGRDGVGVGLRGGRQGGSEDRHYLKNCGGKGCGDA